MLGERKSSMCRSRVARGHFTLMATGPIEMTAALHDLKVRRQQIIFQWRSEMVPPKPPPPPSHSFFTAPELLQYSKDGINIAQQPTIITLRRSTHHKTHSTMPVFSAPVHHHEKYCCGKLTSSVCETKQHNTPSGSV